jgi:hypothetical protein
MDKVGINDFILKCWGIDDTGWKFSLFSEGWWDITAVSDSLGEFRIISTHSGDVEETLAELLREIKKAKEMKHE